MAIPFNQNVVFLSLVLIVAIVKAADICNICKCFPYEEDYYVISCKNYKNHIVQVKFENIDWPKNEEDYRYRAFFNNFTMNVLPKISADSNVVSLNLDNNNIRTINSNPFEYFANLEELSLANNQISDLTKDFLKSQSKLKLLNLSNNTLTAIDSSVIAHLKQLQEINLSNNLLTKITADFLAATSHVEVVRLENNKIYAIDNAYDKDKYQLRKLFLAYNQFSVITSSMFEKLTNLEVIDLSGNAIHNIDENSFLKLNSLEMLDLSNNNIKRVTIRLPDSLELLVMSNNNLMSWPLANIPENLTGLDISHNYLDFIFPNDKNVPNLVKLDISNNLIHALPDVHFIKLEILDLGFNLLKTIPQDINTKAPFLRELILDGNEISNIDFVEPTTLGFISLCNLTHLTKINAFALANLSGTQITFDKSETCVMVKISNNENLVEIEPNAFYGVRFCDLDLSYNNLQTIPRNLTSWNEIENGVNLQGNPLLCDCEHEWILEDIMQVLYENLDHQEKLLELRCQSPEEFKRKRLVHFYKHDNPFCKTIESSDQIYESGFGRFIPDLLTKSDPNQSSLKLTPWTPGFLIIVSLCSIILILIIIVGVKWQKDQNLKLARRNRLYYDDY